MNEKKKSTPNARALTVVLIILVLGSIACFVFAVVTGVLRSDVVDPTEPSAEVTTGVVLPSESTAAPEETDADNTATTSATDASMEKTGVAGADFEISDSYYAASAVDLEGNPVDLRTYFGSGFATFGGTLSFDESGAEPRFSINMGISSGSSSSVGTYSVIAYGSMELRFDNSDVTVATFEIEDHSVVSLEVPMDDIVVTFKAN